jgi:putative transposase
MLIEELIEEELAVALGRGRYERRHRRGAGAAGSSDGPPAVETGDVAPGASYQHGHRERRLTGSFGTVEIAVPRARIGGADSPDTGTPSGSAGSRQTRQPLRSRPALALAECNTATVPVEGLFSEPFR